MGEIDELRAKVIASMAAGGNPNSKQKGAPATLREEGEISSDDEDMPTSSSINASTSILTGSAHLNSKNEQRKRPRSGVPHANCYPSSLIDGQWRVSTSKRIRRLPNKFYKRSWHRRSGSNDNLIISFSEGDDTESNSENSDLERTVKEEVEKVNVDGSGRLLGASNLQAEMQQDRPNNKVKALSTKTMLDNSSGSFLTKLQNSYWCVSDKLGTLKPEKEASISRHDVASKVLQKQEVGPISGKNTADGKMRSLRQQIAVRESELKLQKRSAPECKDRNDVFVDASYHDNNMKPSAKAFQTERTLGNVSTIGGIMDPNASDDCISNNRMIMDLNASDECRSNNRANGLPQMQVQILRSDSETKNGALLSSPHLEVLAGREHQLNKGTATEEINAKRGDSNSDPHVSSGAFPLQIKDKKNMNLINSNNSSRPNGTEECSMDREVLLTVEELHDKELEEAQEIRRKCELEEMHALKAYRRAREALIAANSRCSFLYKRRELLSLFASRSLSHSGTIHRTSDDLLSELNHLMDAEGQFLDQVGYICGNQNDPSHSTSNLQMIGSSLRENQHHDHVNISNSDHITRQSEQPNVAVDGDKTVKQKVVNPVGRMVDGIEKKMAPGQHTHDVELEASLRSKLVARLGAKSATRSTGTCNADRVSGSEMDAHDDQCDAYITLMQSLSSQQFLEEEKVVANIPNASNGNSSSPRDSLCTKGPPCPKNVDIGSICSVMQIICKHFKLLFPESSSLHKEAVGVLPMAADGDKEHDICASNSATFSSHNVDLKIDPFWPLCTFDLRGKCNDEECPWQHLKERSQRKEKQLNFTSLSSGANGGQDDSSEDLLKINAVCRSTCSFKSYIVSIPIYRIGSSLVIPDVNLSQPLLASSMQQYWQNHFCISFSLPFSIQRILPPDAPILHGDIDTKDSDDWTRPSSYFSRTVKRLKPCPGDPEQALELAIDILHHKNKTVDVERKALVILARAIEAHPKYAPLWIVYLQILYRKEKQLRDDMFSYAVKFNEGSYELWSLYINSKMHVSDRMNAYDKALSVLCRWAHTSDVESKHISTCILDLSLQMIDFMCTSGNIDKAMSRVYELCPATNSRTYGHTLFSDILSPLVFSDRCIFWICCIYLVMYRKLPKAIVQQIEFEKDLPFNIEWPTTQLSPEGINRVLELMGKAIDALPSGDDTNSYQEGQSWDNSQRSSHFLAICHIKCVSRIDGLDSAVTLLAKYMRKHPTCVELLMLSARLQKFPTLEAFIEGFQRAIDNWPKEIPGSQCLWNQYAEYALGNGRVDFAKKLMEYWFESFAELESTHNDSELRMDYCDSPDPKPTLLSASFYSNKIDAVFGSLNLCLYKLLHNNVEEARSAIDKALDLSTAWEFGHCVKELFSFVFFSGSTPLGDRPHSAIHDLLVAHLRDNGCCTRNEPLSRTFCRNIKKPRLRQLINSFLGTVSLDFSLLNSVLEELHGPSSMPKTFKEPKDLVDYVESLMAIAPANYRLLLSVYNFVVSNHDHNAFASKSILFWVSCLLINSIFQSFPVAPEAVWLQAATILDQVGIQEISEAFYQQAVSVYPFSLRLWQSYFNLSKKVGKADFILEAAKRRGFELN